MRTIKFRGKDSFERRWIIGALAPNGKHPCIAEFGKCFELTEVDYESVGQFTGQLDKYGKDIYEGDIVKYYDEIEDELVAAPVIFHESSCSFCCARPGYDIVGLGAYWDFEIVGNIHDNPELLKGGKHGNQ